MTKFGRCLWLCLLFLIFANETASATVVLVIVEHDAVWIAADGTRSSKEAWWQVCKTHEAYGGVLLKFGFDQEVNGASWSTDQDIEKLLQSKKSFAEFKPAAIAILRQRVAAEAAIDEAKAVNMAEVNGAVDGDLVGLVYVGVSNGHLFVEELNIAPSWTQIQFGENPKFHFTVPMPDWKIVSDQPAFHLYPPILSMLPANQQFILQHPEQLGAFLGWMEKETPCRVGPPNAFLRITVHSFEPGLKQKTAEVKRWKDVAEIDWKNRGACPSWSMLSAPRPSTCTPSEQDRENNEFGSPALNPLDVH